MPSRCVTKYREASLGFAIRWRPCHIELPWSATGRDSWRGSVAGHEEYDCHMLAKVHNQDIYLDRQYVPVSVPPYAVKKVETAVFYLVCVVLTLVLFRMSPHTAVKSKFITTITWSGSSATHVTARVTGRKPPRSLWVPHRKQ